MILYLVGFGAGILCANLIQKQVDYQTSLLPVYLAAFDGTRDRTEVLFRKFLTDRGSFMLFLIICGLTVLGVPAVTASLLWFGFLAGNLITLFLLEYGIRGMAMGTVCFLPQAFFYIPGWMFLFFAVVNMSQKIWGKGKREKTDYKAYFFFVSGAGVCILLGVWMESYVNQNLLSFLLQKWI